MCSLTAINVSTFLPQLAQLNVPLGTPHDLFLVRVVRRFVNRLRFRFNSLFERRLFHRLDFFFAGRKFSLLFHQLLFLFSHQFDFSGSSGF